MLVTELTSQLDRSELKDEAPQNNARRGARQERQRAHKQGREAVAPYFMLVTLLTSHRERSLLKCEHW